MHSCFEKALGVGTDRNRSGTGEVSESGEEQEQEWSRSRRQGVLGIMSLEKTQKINPACTQPLILDTDTFSVNFEVETTTVKLLNRTTNWLISTTNWLISKGFRFLADLKYFSVRVEWEFHDFSSLYSQFHGFSSFHSQYVIHDSCIPWTPAVLRFLHSVPLLRSCS